MYLNAPTLTLYNEEFKKVTLLSHSWHHKARCLAHPCGKTVRLTAHDNLINYNEWNRTQYPTMYHSNYVWNFAVEPERALIVGTVTVELMVKAAIPVPVGTYMLGFELVKSVVVFEGPRPGGTSWMPTAAQATPVKLKRAVFASVPGAHESVFACVTACPHQTEARNERLTLSIG